MRKTITKIAFIIFGLFSLGVGLFSAFTTFRSMQGKDFFKMLGVSLMMIVMGFLFTWKADAIAEANEPERVGKANKYVIRQLSLFLMFIILYIAVAVYTLINNPTIKAVWFVLGGLFVVVGALILLAIQSIKYRKTTHIQDGFFENVKLHENQTLFTMVIDYCWYEDGNLYMRGNVHGKVNQNDKFYLYYPEGKSFYGHISRIEIEGKQVQSVQNRRATLLMTSKREVQFPLYIVCSSCIPFNRNDLDQNMSNPRVLSLINDYQYQVQKSNYMGYAIEAIVHGRYLVRVVRKTQAQNVFQKLYDFFFPYTGSYMLGTVTNDVTEQNAIAIYTDWPALKMGKDTNEKEKEAMVLMFDELQKIIFESFHLPVVINPFSSQHFYMSLDFLRDIVSTKVYQEEFGKKE